MTKIKPASLIKAINLYPGSGEYIYEMNPLMLGGVAVNIHNDQNKPDIILSIEQLKRDLPNVEYITVPINWFASSLDAGKARIVPKVEFNDNPLEWQVAGYARENAEEVLRFPNGDLTYGGTPSDKSIVELCKFLKDQGYKVMISLSIMVDDESLTKPWHGDIKPKGYSIRADIDHFFNGENSYNKYALHYTKLEYNGIALKDLIDSFVIACELKGLTTAKSGSIFPAVNQLVSLATEVKNILGTEVKVTYSANWGEYHSAIGGVYHLDALWRDENIDAVGISAFFPITDRLLEKEITYAKVKQGWHANEGWEFYYSSNKKEPFNDCTWAWKNFKCWWENDHETNGVATGWYGKLKPLWLTEYGFPSIKLASNNPNFFYDPTSGNAAPIADNNAQAINIAASEEYFAMISQQNEGLAERRFLSYWDSRPYPAFPNRCDYWSDCEKYLYSHTINGKINQDTLVEITGEVPSNNGIEL